MPLPSKLINAIIGLEGKYNAVKSSSAPNTPAEPTNFNSIASYALPSLDSQTTNSNQQHSLEMTQYTSTKTAKTMT